MRVLVEGAVIVASILLAFGIDAWWDGHLERVDEREILAALETEFTANLDLLDRVIETHTANRKLLEEGQAATADEIRRLPQAEISRWMLGTCNPWTFDAVLGTTDALIGSGRLEILRSRELREALTAFVNLFEDAAEDAAYVGSSAEAVWGAEIDLGGPWTDPSTEVAMNGRVPVPAFVPRATAEDLLRARAHQPYMGLVARCQINIGYYLTELVRLREEAANVLDLVARSRGVQPAADRGS